jgi:hypothetical protein
MAAFPRLKNQYELWTRGYFCSTIGEVSQKTLEHYIENRGDDSYATLKMWHLSRWFSCKYFGKSWSKTMSETVNAPVTAENATPEKNNSDILNVFR